MKVNARPERRKRLRRVVKPKRIEEFTAETVPDERLEEPADDLTYVYAPPRRELRLLRSRPAELITVVDLGRTPLTVSLPVPVQVNSSVEPNYLRHSFRGFTVCWAKRGKYWIRRTHLTCRREKGEVHCTSVAEPPVSLPLKEWLVRC